MLLELLRAAAVGGPRTLLALLQRPGGVAEFLRAPAQRSYDLNRRLAVWLPERFEPQPFDL